MDLFIPAKINKDNILGNGFGKRELYRLLVISAVGLGVGLLAALLAHQKLQISVLMILGVTVSFAACGYFLFLKNAINQSVYDMLNQCVHFYRSQRVYPYRRMREWL